MKLLTFLCVFVLLCSSCTHQIPVHERADMPDDTEPRREQREKLFQKKKSFVSPGEALALAFAAGLISYWFYDTFGNKKRRGDCNDCLGDGEVNSGDPRAIIYIFREAYTCPVCNGDGHL